jgi:mono/diheme cytochrome c family protein
MTFSADLWTGGSPVANFATPQDPRTYATASSSCKKLQGDTAIMKMTKLVVLIVTIALALFILIPNLSWAAEDGAAIYKAKCAACHGADGAGKPAAKIPALKSDDMKKKSADDITSFLGSNLKHAGVAKALNPDQTKAVVDFVVGLNK